MNKQKEPLNNIYWKEVKVSLFKYFKIIALSFFLPLFIALIVNEVAAVSKIAYWVKQDINFRDSFKKHFLTLLITFFPFAHFYKHYLLLIKKILIQLYEDSFEKLFEELSDRLVHSLFKKNKEGKKSDHKIDVDDTLLYINKVVSKLPKFLAWIAKKLLEKIPYLEFISSYEQKDLKEEKRKFIAKEISEKINESAKEIIDSIFPGWTIFVIPVNILLLIYYIFM